MSKKTWLITGTSQGFGKELVKHILENGDEVIATSRNPSALEEFRSYGDQLMVRGLDIKNRDSSIDLTREAIDRFGKIDVLINNIGYGLAGGIEEVKESEWREQFEINVFGTLHITQAVLPYMRARKSGYIQVLSSIAGLRATPGAGYYNGTKFALEGMFEALSSELAPLNIGVTIIEPGPFRTNFAGDSIRISENLISDYAEITGPFREYLKKANGNQAGDPVKAAKIMVDLAERDKKPIRLLLGKMAFNTYKTKLQQELERINEWQSISESADF
jgi:short-subunit dehydrogenase